MTTDLESLTQGLFDAVDAALGDTIIITPSGGYPITAKAHVFHRDRRVDIGISSATVLDALIDIDKSILPSKPGIGWRVTLSRITGRTFEPRDVQNDDSGLRWEFGLKEIP